MRVTAWSCIVASAEAHGVSTEAIASGRTREASVIVARRAAWVVASELLPDLSNAELGRETNINRKAVAEGIGIVRRRAEWCHETAALLGSIRARALQLGAVDRSTEVHPHDRVDGKRAVAHSKTVIDPAKAAMARSLRRKGWSIKGIAKHLELDARDVAVEVGEDPRSLGGDIR